MSENRTKFSSGCIFVFLSIVVVFGAIGVSYAERLSPFGSNDAENLPSQTAAVQGGVTPFTESAPGNENISASATPEPTVTFPPPPANCLPPNGWVPYIVKEGDSIESLATKTNVTPQDIIDTNCLATNTILPESIIYIPIPIASSTPVPTNTIVGPSCGPPAGWITHKVKEGENLFRISLSYQTTIAKLQSANCMGSSTTIQTGASIYVPNVATITPTKTATSTISPTLPVTATPSTTATVTATKVSTATATATTTATVTITQTPNATTTPSTTASPYP